MTRKIVSGTLWLVTGFAPWVLFAQRIPDPHTGDPQWRRQGIMDGNLVRTIFINHGEIAHWPDQPSGEWPKGSGHSYVDGVALIVQAATNDSHGNRIHPLETNYREFVDVSPDGKVWGWAPLPGYFNPKAGKPAMSDDPTSWPPFWPDKPLDWAGYWNGFFGKGVKNADLESYFVFDDDPDEEFDFYPDPTDSTRRGLGLEVAARLFQWSHVLAEDVIFAIYFITNEGKSNYDSTYYAFYIDWGIGGTADSADDAGGYNTILDIAWAWDVDGFGSPGRWAPVGVGGFAFLESPGIPWDGKDNDTDGLIDERRDSGPGIFLTQFPYGVADVEAFREYYNREPAPHWSGDEDGDWRAFTDVNGNGQWDAGEPLNDDLGTDGIGPFDEGYTGPDAGEGDGQPTAGEPNFDFTDKDESDQIGLTGFEVFAVHFYELWNDEQDWGVFRKSVPPGRAVTLNPPNLGMFFSSGSFPLRAGQTENYSMALLFGEDEDDLVRTKKTVQQIYNADYRFAKPPDKPTLTAIPGDKQVILLWDDKAERSYDPFLQKFDFEGYRIYRSTDPEFLEVRLITDSYGRLTFRKPIVQFDLKDGIKGLHPIDVNGVKFDLGNDTGLRHTYVDRDVQNGQTYYYAVVSYDQGFVDTSAVGLVEGITPAESPSVIKKDVAGNVQIDINTAIVTPNAPAAGYVPPRLEKAIEHQGPGTGYLEVNFVVPNLLKDGHTYEVAFQDTSFLHNAGVPDYRVTDVTAQEEKVSLRPLVAAQTESPLVDGLVLDIFNDTQVRVDPTRTGWVVGRSNYLVDVSFDPTFTNPNNPTLNINTPIPSDFEIRFSNQVVDTSDRKLGFPATPVKFEVWDLTANRRAQFLFRDIVPDGTLTPDTTESIILFVDNPQTAFKVSTTWRILFETNPELGPPVAPAPGDIYRLATTKPFRTGDVFRFTIKAPAFSPQKAREDLAKIAVVPNPYVVAASWEPKSPFRFGRGERRVYFINLPAKCTIRIYTVRGYLVDTIEHDSTIENGAAPWNLVSKDGMDIAYGVYLYHVDAPGIGTTIGKFAVIK